jgi:putative sigma-54 modulation protein
MANRVDLQARNMPLTPKVEAYIRERAGRLDKYLPLIEEARVELTHHKSVRSSNDRNVAQITVFGKGTILRTEERADEALAAFDAALDHLQRKIERHKGKHYHGRGDGRSAADVVLEAPPPAEAEAHTSRIVRRKRFVVLPMNEQEAIEQMRLLGHESFFVFYNGTVNKFNVLYRRRDGTYGLIETEVG